MITELAFLPLDQAADVANCPGLTTDLIRQLAKRDKVLPWGELPGRGLVVEQSALLKIADVLRQARAEAAEQYINAHEAELRYGVHRSTWGRYRDRGIIRTNDENLLFLEDIAFIVALSEFIKPKSGRPLFPNSYVPNYTVAPMLTKQHHLINTST
jgi:hypothetical protein